MGGSVNIKLSNEMNKDEIALKVNRNSRGERMSYSDIKYGYAMQNRMWSIFVDGVVTRLHSRFMGTDYLGGDLLRLAVCWW